MKRIASLLFFFALLASACGKETPIPTDINSKPTLAVLTVTPPQPTKTPTIVPSPTESPYASISTMEQMRAYVEKTWPDLVKNPDIELKPGDALSEKVDAQRKAFDAFTLSWQAEKLGKTEAEISAMSVRGELLSAFNKAGFKDVMLTTKQAFELITTQDQLFSEDIDVGGVKLPFGYQAQLRGPAEGYTSLFDDFLNDPMNQYTPIYDLLFGQHLGKIHFRIFNEGNPSGYATMRIYYATDTKQDQKVALFTPDGRFVDMALLSYGQHNQPMEIGMKRDFNNHTLPQGTLMEQTVIWPSDNHTHWLRLTPELLDAIITSKNPVYVSCATNASGIQDGVAVHNVIIIDSKLFETLKSDPRFSALFVQQ
jgi:hypothetical protein